MKEVTKQEIDKAMYLVEQEVEAHLNRHFIKELLSKKEWQRLKQTNMEMWSEIRDKGNI
jgi:hypothetical protein